MKLYRLSPKLVRYLSLATFTTFCMFASTTHAVLIGESQACGSGTPQGDANWVGAAYFPHSRTSVTHQRYESLDPWTTIKVDLWAYPEGGDTVVSRRQNQSTAYGTEQLANSVSARYFNHRNSPGWILAFHFGWSPTMSRFNGSYARPDAPLNSYNCRTDRIFF